MIPGKSMSESPSQSEMFRALEYPFDIKRLAKQKRALRRALFDRGGLLEKRIAILGGSTTSELKDFLELFLLKAEIKPTFYESEYGKYFEDVMLRNADLLAFKPDVVWICTSQHNLDNVPAIGMSADQVGAALQSETARFTGMWRAIRDELHCPVIQNNFDLPAERPLGNMDATSHWGKTRFINSLNEQLASEISPPNVYLNDIHYLSSLVGLNRWHDRSLWYSYKYACSYEGIVYQAHGAAGIIGAIFGKSKKCLVLDLDNTLWGGVIGDDGLENIQIGRETAVAEAYHAFQQYAQRLRQRGVVLAVCSKNDEENAKLGFSHPDTVLTLDEISSFVANWEHKPANIASICRQLDLSPDSSVFVDDNAAERALVSTELPTVTVPELGGDVSRYIDILDRGNYFEPAALSDEDLKRTDFYRKNAARQDVEANFGSYEDFLASLAMRAEIKPFSRVYLDRITQLTNKTNQFNLTTRRYTMPEIESAACDLSCMTLYGRLSDRFGDNGLVSVVIGRRKEDELSIDLWLMSCRVLKRGMELAMFDEVVRSAKSMGVRTIKGSYLKTMKNGMVASFYKTLGFEKISETGAGDSTWEFSIPDTYRDQNAFIRVNSEEDSDDASFR